MKEVNKIFVALLLVAALIVNGVAILLDILPIWWYKGMYALPHWFGASVSFTCAAGIITLILLGRRVR